MTEGPIEILLVEDNPSDAELTLHCLRKKKLANYIHWARDGEEALDFLFCTGEFSTRSFNDAPKLVLLDLKLPKVDGLEILKRMKQDSRTKLIPVLILTSSKEDRDIVQGYDLGANGYVQKPVGFDEFRAVVETIGYFWLITNHPPMVRSMELQGSSVE